MKGLVGILLLLTAGIDIRRSQLVTITEGDLLAIGAETFQIFGEPMGYTLGLVLNCEAVTI